jgi:hypothetical protein
LRNDPELAEESTEELLRERVEDEPASNGD